MYGFLFMFFSHEHEPVHVHVIGNDGEAKYVLKDGKFIRERSVNIKVNDLKRISRIIQSNSDIIVKRWSELFGDGAHNESNEDMV